MRTLYLIRHGRPDFPGGAMMCLGRTDMAIGALGRLQSALCGFALRDAGLTAVFCSKLLRSRQTAEYIGEGVVELAGLEELDAGDWDGLTFAEIRERWPELYEARRTNPSLQPPGGEDKERGRRRFIAALGRALEGSRGDIAVVAHASVIQLLLCSVLGLPLETSRDLPIPYGSITPLQFEDGSFIAGDVVSPRPDLDEAVCRLLLEALDTPPDIDEHCAAVAKRAMKIVAALAAAAVDADAERIYAAARLHDIARAEPNHAEAGARLITELGYPEVGRLIKSHHNPDAPAELNAAIVYLADKTVLGTQTVTLAERFAQSREKCDTPEAIAAWEKRYAAAKAAAERINGLCGKEVITCETCSK